MQIQCILHSEHLRLVQSNDPYMNCIGTKCGMLRLLCKCFLRFDVEVSTDGSNFIFGRKKIALPSRRDGDIARNGRLFRRVQC